MRASVGMLVGRLGVPQNARDAASASRHRGQQQAGGDRGGRAGQPSRKLELARAPHASSEGVRLHVLFDHTHSADEVTLMTDAAPGKTA